jgi:hypothetical protein
MAVIRWDSTAFWDREKAQRQLAYALPAAVGVGAAVLTLTAGARLVGPDLIRQHANGATLALLGMGAPLHWNAPASHVSGSLGIGTYPMLAIASAVMLAVTVAIGWATARRNPDRPRREIALCTSAWFAAFCTLASAAVSLGPAVAIRGITIHLGFSAPVVLGISAAWGLLGASAGALVGRRITTPERRTMRAWVTRGPSAAVVAGAVTVLAVAACGADPGTTAAAAKAPSQTTTSLVPQTTLTTASPEAVAASAAAAAAATRSTTARAARAATAAAASSGSATRSAASAAAVGFPPAVPGVYSYNTTGSTSSLAGKQTFPSVTTLTVDAPVGTRQHSVRQLIAGNGDGFMIDQTLDYQPTGVAVLQQRVTMIQKGNKTVRTLTAAPATVVIPLGAVVGSHRQFSLTGSTIAGNEVVDIVQAGTVAVGGQSVAANLIRTVLTVSGKVTGTIQLEQWWAPSSRVPLKEQLTGSMKSGFVTAKVQYDATLQKLTPG